MLRYDEWGQVPSDEEATELPGQLRSQTEFGNEEARESALRESLAQGWGLGAQPNEYKKLQP
ncbi:MAG: hypothetical protein H0X40_15670 [Chthoniobacterales bacterium]|nr:hypothetical protein [Chthoniobacterales bacterium]